LSVQFAYSQVNDAGLWLSLNAEKKITPILLVTLSQEFRMNENITELGSYFTDAGIAYKINKNIHISANYRFINKRKLDDSYNIRNRYYFDLTLRKKFKPILIQFRTRFQGQRNQIYKNSEDNEPFYYFRNKLTVKMDFDKKYTPFIYSEISTPLNKPDGYYIDLTKYCAGLEYRFNRMHSIELFYLIQKEYNVVNPETDYVTGIGYYLTF